MLDQKTTYKSHYLTCNRYWSMVVGLISHLSSTWLLTASTYWPVNIKINSPFTHLMIQDLQKWCLWMNELLICLIQLAVWVVWLCCVQILWGVKVSTISRPSCLCTKSLQTCSDWFTSFCQLDYKHLLTSFQTFTDLITNCY